VSRIAGENREQGTVDSGQWTVRSKPVPSSRGEFRSTVY
jgi:hypothetical protein